VLLFVYGVVVCLGKKIGSVRVVFGNPFEGIVMLEFSEIIKGELMKFEIL
jgi:hypothetical protein